MSKILKSSTQMNLLGRRIDHGRLKLVDILGKGGYGIVYRALDTISPATSPEYYAVKCLRKASADPMQCLEVKLHLKLSSNPNILTIHHYFQDRNHIYIVMDLCTGGDLYNAVHGDKVPRAYHMDDAKTKTAILQSIDTVSACHDAGIFHRDIKLDNLVCDTGGLNIRLTDFGMSTRSTQMRVIGAGTHGYLAPECTKEHLGASYSTREADVWALGVLIFHLINGELPWDDASPEDPYYSKFLQDPDSLMRYNPMSRDAHEVLKKVFVSSVEERITLPELRAEFEKLDTFYDHGRDAEFSRSTAEFSLAFETEDLSSDSFHARSRSTAGAQYGIMIDLPPIISDNEDSSDGVDAAPVALGVHAINSTVLVVLPELHAPKTIKKMGSLLSMIHRVKAVGTSARRRCSLAFLSK